MRPRLEEPTAGLRIVLDTNVVVSAILSLLRGREESPSLLIFNLLAEDSDKSPVLLLSDAILAEYSTVLERPRFGIPPEVIRKKLDLISATAVMLRPGSRIEVVDRKDSVFLECALDGLADYLITGNKRHYPNWTIVVTPREFLNMRKG